MSEFKIVRKFDPSLTYLCSTQEEFVRIAKLFYKHTGIRNSVVGADLTRGLPRGWSVPCTLSRSPSMLLFSNIDNLSRQGAKIYLPKETSMNLKQTVEKYLEENSTLIMTLVVVFLADYFFLRGALRSRIQGMLTGVLDRVESSIKLPTCPAKESTDE